MSSVFLRLLNISITAGWIVLVVVLLRFVLKKAPKWIRVALWGLVALRLLLPVSVESALSLVPSAETVKIESVTAPVLTSVSDSNGSSYFYEDVQGERIVLQSGFSALNSAVNPPVETAAKQFDTVVILKTVAGWVWLFGAVAMLLYALISYLRLRHRVRASVKIEKGVYVCDDISDPFILGLIVPKIYLPSGMDKTTRTYVLAHERAHLSRFDHIWKPLGFLLLAVYWFNPLLWLAYILLCRDIELACDEKVVEEYDAEAKAAYSEALVKSSVSRRSIAACPLAFGEVGVKSRIKSILNYKKPAFWIILVALLAGIVTAVCFLTVPKKDKSGNAEFFGTWEFYKLISDTYEEDALIATMLDGNIDRITFQEDGTGTWLYCPSTEIKYENPFTYTVSGNKVFITRTGRDKKPVEFTYDPESGMLRSPEDAGEGQRWYTLYVREGSITYPTVQLTNEQIAGEWITDGLPIMEGKPLTLTGSLVFDTDGTAALHLHGDNNTEMNVTGTYKTDNSVIRFETDDNTAVLEYLSYFDMDVYFHLYIKDILPEGENAFLASYDPQTDTIRIVVLKFGVLTFRRATPARSAVVMQWLDYRDAFNELPWDGDKEMTVDAFPNIRFRWTSGSVEAVENGKTRTLFTGMPIWNVFFADLTGDGKPELCATVSFGSGIVDDHIVVYDYANRQRYTLWDRGAYDYHLYTENGALLVGKTLCNSYSSDTSILDTGTLVMQDGLLCCRWHSDGSFTPLNRELHESELYGEWIVEAETDNDGNVLYAFDVASTWKEYNFREDGTVTYNETVPVSSDYEKAFGHPVTYPYEVHNDYVYIAGDDTSGAFRWGTCDREARTIRLAYNTDSGTVYAILRRMGTDAPQTIEEILLGTYVCTGAEQNGQSVPIPAEYAGMTIDLGETSEDGTYKHTSTVTIGGEAMNGYGWTLDEDDMLTVWNPKTGKSMRFEWFPKQTACTTLKLTIDEDNPITVIFTVEDDVPLPATDAAPSLTQDQADAFVNGLSVELEDGSPYGCDLVVFIDGFGECLNVGDADAWKTASLRFVPGDYKVTDAIYPHVGYAELLTVGDREYYLGSIRVFLSDGQLGYHRHIWDNKHPSADASIFVSIDSSMMERNRSCPERACVIKSFDAEAQTVTVSFAPLDMPERDGYPITVNYDNIEEETHTFHVTDDTMLILIDDYTALVKPDGFFRYLEQNGYMYLDRPDSDDRGIGFWIGLDGDTLLYLCEVYEE